MAVQTEVVGALRLVPVLIAAHTLVRLALALLPVLKLVGQNALILERVAQRMVKPELVVTIACVRYRRMSAPPELVATPPVILINVVPQPMSVGPQLEIVM